MQRRIDTTRASLVSPTLRPQSFGDWLQKRAQLTLVAGTPAPSPHATRAASPKPR